MDLIRVLRPVYDFNFFYAQRLVADIEDELMCAQPVEERLMNHPAWTIGHLAWANDNAMALLGTKPALVEWRELLGTGSRPAPEREAYPEKSQLLKMLEASHMRLGGVVSTASAGALKKPAPQPMRDKFPTVGHVILGLMTSHYASHLGQLSAWRRAMGFPSVF